MVCNQRLWILWNSISKFCSIFSWLNSFSVFCCHQPLARPICSVGEHMEILVHICMCRGLCCTWGTVCWNINLKLPLEEEEPETSPKTTDMKTCSSWEKWEGFFFFCFLLLKVHITASAREWWSRKAKELWNIMMSGHQLAILYYLLAKIFRTCHSNQKWVPRAANGEYLKHVYKHELNIHWCSIFCRRGGWS